MNDQARRVLARFLLYLHARSSEVRVGPRMNVGLTTTSSVLPPSLRMKSQAARSAIALDFG